ncbi:MFS transporter [Kolteria novifilia]|uniref:MFS transporter n=1 Tax=Kolteria novifilia TaxID=2527975 RepID=UPI003AF351D8
MESQGDIGSARAWLVWGVAASMNVTWYLAQFELDAIGDDVVASLSLSVAELGAIGGAIFLVYGSLQLVVGVLLDRLSTRWLLTTAAGLAAIGNLLFAMAPSFEVALAGRVLMGAGNAFAFLGPCVLAVRWFPASRFAFLAGMTSSVAAIVGSVGTIVMQEILAFTSWRGLVLGMGAINLLQALLIGIIVRDFPRGRREETTGGSSLKASLAAIGANPQVWLAAVCAASLVGNFVAWSSLWNEQWQRALGFTQGEAATMTAVLIVGVGLGNVGSGWISDRLRRRRLPMLVGIVVSLGLMINLLFGPEPSFAIGTALLFVLGLFLGTLTLTYAVVRDSVPGRASGTALGLMNIFAYASGAVLQFIPSLMLPSKGPYSPAELVGPLSILPAIQGIALLVALFWLRESYPIETSTLAGRNRDASE